jgi:hypothetical protein
MYNTFGYWRIVHESHVEKENPPRKAELCLFYLHRPMGIHAVQVHLFMLHIFN